MQSKAKSVAEYLAQLPADRRAAIETVRAVILKNLDPVMEEGMLYGMIGYYVPHSVYPPGYHCDPKLPLGFACLASQKNYMSVYLVSTYGHTGHEQWFRAAWAKTGKRLDMGKSCVRFKKVEDLALEVIGESIRRVPTKKFIEHYESMLQTVRTKPAGGKTAKPARAKARPKPRKAAPAKRKQ
jgi:hypothetical protein